MDKRSIIDQLRTIQYIIWNADNIGRDGWQADDIWPILHNIYLKIHKEWNGIKK